MSEHFLISFLLKMFRPTFYSSYSLNRRHNSLLQTSQYGKYLKLFLLFFIVENRPMHSHILIAQIYSKRVLRIDGILLTYVVKGCQSVCKSFYPKPKVYNLMQQITAEFKRAIKAACVNERVDYKISGQTDHLRESTLPGRFHATYRNIPDFHIFRSFFEFRFSIFLRRNATRSSTQFWRKRLN